MTRAEASRLIDIGMGKLPRSEQKITPESEIPATEAQRKVLEELREKGKIPEYFRTSGNTAGGWSFQKKGRSGTGNFGNGAGFIYDGTGKDRRKRRCVILK